MKEAGILDVLLRGVNDGFWSYLGCSAHIFLIAKYTKETKFTIRLKKYIINTTDNTVFFVLRYVTYYLYR